MEPHFAAYEARTLVDCRLQTLYDRDDSVAVTVVRRCGMRAVQSEGWVEASRTRGIIRAVRACKRGARCPPTRAPGRSSDPRKAEGCKHTKEVMRSDFRTDGHDFWMYSKLKKEKNMRNKMWFSVLAIVIATATVLSACAPAAAADKQPGGNLLLVGWRR